MLWKDSNNKEEFMKINLPVVIIKMSFSVIIAMWLLGCATKTVTAAGNQETYTYTVSEYNKIRIEGNCEIHYYSAPSNTVILAIQPNLYEHYVVEVINSELIVRPKRNIRFTGRKHPVLTVSTPALNQLTVSGASDFIAHDKIISDSLNIRISGVVNGKAELDTDKLAIGISGSGKFDLSGRADTVDLELSGAGELNAFSLISQEVSVTLSGASKVRVNCSELLRIKASGAATVEYRGSPRINQNTSGAVTIRMID